MPRNISIGESYAKGFKPLSYATKHFEGVDHSHLFVTWKDEFGNRWVAELRGGGARIVSNREFKETNYVVNIYPHDNIPEEIYKEAMFYIWDKSDIKYSKLGMFGLFLMRVLNRFARAIGWKRRFYNFFRDGEYSQICCEFALNVLKIIKRVEFWDRVENFGLIETRIINRSFSYPVDKDKIDKINNV